MGASFAKLNCCGRIRKNKIGVVSNSLEIINRIETRPSTEILQELQRVGIISERSGGVRFIVETLTESEMINPRRLPAISISNDLPRRRLTDKSRASTSKDIYDNEDKGLMVEIRRMDALADKGKMAKESERRRQEAKVRRDKRLKEKIIKTENKLRRGDRVEGVNQEAIPKPKREKGRRPAREPRPIKPAVSGLPDVSV
ncbi:Hypothetical predicted protein [Mytilus galloprovincialis]|uniref:Uncharacterized protein n=1 Tax=Mytilus galloprovincialis TaxID=29158 RepID=A0A8B6ECG4_MYTGA|nr:Hypothetical predicted protein [Mytilus galloprovincialis]